MFAPAPLLLAQLTTTTPAVAESLPFEIRGDHAAAALVYVVQADAHSPTHWSRVIRITVVGDAAHSTDGLRVVDPIVVETDSGESASIHPEAQPPAEQLAPGAPLPVRLETSFARTGSYRGDLVLVQGARHQVFPIQITVDGAKSREALPVEQRGGTALAITDGVLGASPLVVEVRLQNTELVPVEVVGTLAAVSRVEKVQATTAPFSVGAAVSDGKDLQRTIEPGKVASFEMPLAGMEEAGVYSVETSFDDAEGKYQPHSTKTTVYRRESWAHAALAVFAGALLAWLVRWFVSGGKDRLDLRRRIALLIQQLRLFRGGARTEPLIAAARILELDVEDRQRDARFGKLAELEPIIGRAEQRLALLHEIARAMDQLEGIDVEKQPDARNVLDAALVSVRLDPGDEAKLTASRQAVASLSLRALLRDQRKKQLAELEQSVEGLRGLGAPELDANADALAERIEVANALLRSDDLEALGKVVDEVRRGVLDAGTEQLQRVAAGSPPAGCAPADWAAVAEQMKADLRTAVEATDWARKKAAFDAAQARYLTTQMKGLVAEATRKANAGDSRATALRAMAEKLKAALASGVLGGGARVAEARLLIEAPDPAGVATGLVGRLDPEGRGAGQAVWRPLELTEDRTARPVAPPDVVRLDRALTSYRWLVSAALLIVAVATGVKALWLDNLSWGGESGWLLAFLWGAGVQVTGEAFAGLAALREKLGAMGSSP